MQRLLPLLLVAACAPAAELVDDEPYASETDAAEDGAFGGGSHPAGALVREAERDCQFDVGGVTRRGLRVSAAADGVGLLCATAFDNVGAGHFVMNLRIAPLDARGEGDRELLRIRVTSGDVVVAERILSRSTLAGRRTYSDEQISIDLTAPARALSVEVNWTVADGASGAGVNLDYIELFRPRDAMVLSPASGPIDELDHLDIDLPMGADTRIVSMSCAGHDVTRALRDARAAGVVRESRSDFRTVLRVPFSVIAAGCPEYEAGEPVEIIVESGYLAARVTYFADQIACDFVGTGTRVLVTGFSPFPATASENEAGNAVLAFDPSSLSDAGLDVALMRVILPVEYDTAPELLRELVLRCAPEIVISFGQGGSGVAVETTAYNRKDTPGFPDNRGVIQTGEAIVLDAPEERMTSLPVNAILEAVSRDSAATVTSVSQSDDPGRYICNSLFYEIATLHDDVGVVGGFVHVRGLGTADAQRVVHHAIAETVRALL